MRKKTPKPVSRSVSELRPPEPALTAIVTRPLPRPCQTDLPLPGLPATDPLQHPSNVGVRGVAAREPGWGAGRYVPVLHRADVNHMQADVGAVTADLVKRECKPLPVRRPGEAHRLPVTEHTLVAPTLVRSQALSALYEAARQGEISAAEGIERVTRINSLKVRFLGDKMLQRTAWKVADRLGWETTYDAEFVALTQLQADFFVTSAGDLARAVSGLVQTETIDARG